MAKPSAHWRAVLAFAALLAALPLALPNGYFYDVAILVALNAIVCIGLNLLIGYAGQISLGHAAFFGLGAYGSAILATNYGWPPLASIATAAVAIGLLAFIVGRPVLRLRGHYLAMATLGLGVIASIVVATEDRITGGPDGMSVAPLSLFGASLSDERGWYALVACVLLASIVIAQRLIDSPIGRALRALHAGEAAAQLAGIDAARYKVMAFVLSAVFAAVAGALGAHYSGFITPAKIGFLHSVELVTMVVFGGLASTWGAVVGAAALTLLPHLLTVFKDYEMVVLGGAMMATMILMPRGLVPTLADILHREGPVNPLLGVERIGRVFGGVPALADVSFEMPERGVHAIIGPNGAGKTTLLNVLCGIYAPTSGSVEIDGENFNGRPPHEFAAAGIARTFQTPQVFFNMTALENVEVGSHLHRTRGLAQVLLRLRRFRESEKAGAVEAAHLMREVGLADWLESEADALPYGALKRLEIARALALRPRLLLLDEPAAGLNPNEAGELAGLIRRIADRGVTVALVEHNMRLVMSIADSILVLDHGTRIAAGTPGQVRADPHVIQAYLGADGDPDARG